MHVSITFRQMDPSDALRDYVTRKLEHTVRKYIHAPVDAQAVFSIEKFWHIATLTIQVRGFTVKTQEKTEDMYASVDLALEKLDRRLRRYKDKLRDHKPTGAEAQSYQLQVIEAEPEEEVPPGLDRAELEAAAAGAYDGDKTTPKPEEFGVVDIEIERHAASHGHKHPKILKTKQLAAKPMTVAEAILQLELIPEKFFVFTHADSGNINVVYERDDGNYGLLDTSVR